MIRVRLRGCGLQSLDATEVLAAHDAAEGWSGDDIDAAQGADDRVAGSTDSSDAAVSIMANRVLSLDVRDSAGISHLAGVLAFSNLQSLNVSGCTSLTSLSLGGNAAWPRTLRSVSASHCCLRSMGDGQPLECVEDLDLSHNCLTGGFDLVSMPKLRTLSLAFNPHLQWVGSLSSCSKLDELDVSGTAIGATSSLQGLQQATTLRSLLMFETQASSCPCYRFAVLRAAPQLLLLDNCRVPGSPSGQAAFAASHAVAVLGASSDVRCTNHEKLGVSHMAELLEEERDLVESGKPRSSTIPERPTGISQKLPDMPEFAVKGSGAAAESSAVGTGSDKGFPSAVAGGGSGALTAPARSRSPQWYSRSTPQQTKGTSFTPRHVQAVCPTPGTNDEVRARSRRRLRDRTGNRKRVPHASPAPSAGTSAITRTSLFGATVAFAYPSRTARKSIPNVVTPKQKSMPPKARQSRSEYGRRAVETPQMGGPGGALPWQSGILDLSQVQSSDAQSICVGDLKRSKADLTTGRAEASGTAVVRVSASASGSLAERMKSIVPAAANAGSVAVAIPGAACGAIEPTPSSSAAASPLDFHASRVSSASCPGSSAATGREEHIDSIAVLLEPAAHMAVPEVEAEWDSLSAAQASESIGERPSSKTGTAAAGACSVVDDRVRDSLATTPSSSGSHCGMPASTRRRQVYNSLDVGAVADKRRPARAIPAKTGSSPSHWEAMAGQSEDNTIPAYMAARPHSSRADWLRPESADTSWAHRPKQRQALQIKTEHDQTSKDRVTGLSPWDAASRETASFSPAGLPLAQRHVMVTSSRFDSIEAEMPATALAIPPASSYSGDQAQPTSIRDSAVGSTSNFSGLHREARCASRVAERGGNATSNLAQQRRCSDGHAPESCREGIPDTNIPDDVAPTESFRNMSELATASAEGIDSRAVSRGGSPTRDIDTTEGLGGFQWPHSLAREVECGIGSAWCGDSRLPNRLLGLSSQDGRHQGALQVQQSDTAAPVCTDGETSHTAVEEGPSTRVHRRSLTDWLHGMRNIRASVEVRREGLAVAVPEIAEQLTATDMAGQGSYAPSVSADASTVDSASNPPNVDNLTEASPKAVRPVNRAPHASSVSMPGGLKLPQSRASSRSSIVVVDGDTGKIPQTSTSSFPMGRDSSVEGESEAIVQVRRRQRPGACAEVEGSAPAPSRPLSASGSVIDTYALPMAATGIAGLPADPLRSSRPARADVFEERVPRKLRLAGSRTSDAAAPWHTAPHNRLQFDISWQNTDPLLNGRIANPPCAVTHSDSRDSQKLGSDKREHRMAGVSVEPSSPASQAVGRKTRASHDIDHFKAVLAGSFTANGVPQRRFSGSLQPLNARGHLKNGHHQSVIPPQAGDGKRGADRVVRPKSSPSPLGSSALLGRRPFQSVASDSLMIARTYSHGQRQHQHDATAARGSSRNVDVQTLKQASSRRAAATRGRTHRYKTRHSDVANSRCMR